MLIHIRGAGGRTTLCGEAINRSTRTVNMVGSNCRACRDARSRAIAALEQAQPAPTVPESATDAGGDAGSGLELGDRPQSPASVAAGAATYSSDGLLLELGAAVRVATYRNATVTDLDPPPELAGMIQVEIPGEIPPRWWVELGAIIGPKTEDGQ